MQHRLRLRFQGPGRRHSYSNGANLRPRRSTKDAAISCATIFTGQTDEILPRTNKKRHFPARLAGHGAALDGACH